MSAPSLADVFLIGVDVLITTVSSTTKKILASIGTLGSKSTGPDGQPVGGAQTMASNVEWWQHVGFASRPSNPDPGDKTAQAVVIRQGSGSDVCIASQDVRSLSIYGNLKPGETCIYAAGADAKSQGRVLLKADGSVTIYSTKGNAVGGTGMCIQLDAANDTIRLLNSKGHGLVIDANGVSLFTNGGGALKVKPNGDITLAGSGNTVIDGTSIVLGPPGIPVLGAVLHGVTGIAGVASLKVLVGS